MGPMASLTDYVILSSILFALGAIGFVVRRNALILFMTVEMMLNAVNLMLVAFSKFRADMAGQVMVFFIYAVAAAEVAVGLAILIALFRHMRSVDITKYRLMKW